MSRMTKLAATALVGAMAMLPLGARATTHTTSMADVFRAEVRNAARAHHMDATRMMAAKTTIRTIHADGRVTFTTMRMDAAISRVLGGVPSLHKKGAGPEGTPELVAGDVGQVWACALCAQSSVSGYRIVQSALVPSTPAVEPLGIPIIVFEAGGPMFHVSGNWPTGFHGAGFYLLGSNVDTDASGPYVPAPIELLPVTPPVPLPVKGIGIVGDDSMDFLGHIALEADFLDCLFGYCVGAGVLDGDGGAIFDNHPIAGVQVNFPDVP